MHLHVSMFCDYIHKNFLVYNANRITCLRLAIVLILSKFLDNITLTKQKNKLFPDNLDHSVNQDCMAIVFFFHSHNKHSFWLPFDNLIERENIK